MATDHARDAAFFLAALAGCVCGLAACIAAWWCLYFVAPPGAGGTTYGLLSVFTGPTVGLVVGAVAAAVVVVAIAALETAAEHPNDGGP